jgi:hypothetical protein
MRGSRLSTNNSWADASVSYRGWSVIGFENANQIFPIIFVVWIVLGIAGFALFYLNPNVAFKRRYFRWYAVVVGVLFLGFGAAMGIPLQALAFIAPFVGLIMYLNIRATQFCNDCGRTVIQQIPFSRPEFCPKCGARLVNRSKSDHA